MSPLRRALSAAAALAFCVSASAPAPARAAPPAVSPQRAAEREALKAALLDVLQRPNLKASRVALHLQSLDDGTVVMAHHADELLNPASNVKLVTSAAALSVLGSEYRFETEFLTDGDLRADGKARTLYVRGKGDPTITTERLYGLAGELAHAGLREVQDVVVDDAYFDAERTPPGYDQEDSDRAYMAPTGALSLNWNTVGVFVRPGAAPGQKAAVEVEPASDFFVVDSSLTTGSRRVRRVSVSSDPAGDKQKLTVRGVLPAERGGAVSVWKKIDNPPLYFGHTLKALLAQRGVKVKGRVKAGATPPAAKLLFAAQSETLDVILKRLNKNSSNFIAEMLLKTLGAERHGAPGSFPKGVEAVEDFLETKVGIRRGTYVMKNGSGLNDANRFSAAQLDRILRHMAGNFPIAPEYLSSLGIAGKDGTLRYRFEGTEAVGRLRAKTGTLENVSALSGYVVSASGERFTFAAMVNDFAGRTWAVVQGLDAMGAAVASAGATGGPQRALAQAGVTAPPAAGLDALRTRVKTYQDMGGARDARNIPLLRSALRSERDPAVRAVVAEALYQSAPQDYNAVRTLLDQYGTGEEVYGRLRALAAEGGTDVPGLASVVELASGGNVEALTRVIELVRPAGSDARARTELSNALAEVARTASDELIVALKGAQAPDREAAVGLLAQGLGATGEGEHPFWKALRKNTGAQDQALAAFARALDAALSSRMAEASIPSIPPDLQMVAPAGSAGPPRTAETRPGG